MKKTMVIHHSADFDGLFCREIARKHLGDAPTYIGWDYGQPKVVVPPDTESIYVLDLSPECLGAYDASRLIWIDHHKSAIEKFPNTIPGYRIDGVAACRLAWQWFIHHTNGQKEDGLPPKEFYIQRRLSEPLAVQLAGEYDIWDKRNPDVDVFQMGLRAEALDDSDWQALLSSDPVNLEYVNDLIKDGRLLQWYVNQRDADIVNKLGFLTQFEGLKFLALNSATKGSMQFAAKDVPETGHDALLKFNWTGTTWEVSLYHAKHRTDLDLSAIAVKYGGGGHRGACGCRLESIGPVLHGRIPF